MKLKIFLFSLFSIVFLVACTGRSYDNNHVVATLKGEGITVSDILSQYPMEDKYIDIFLKEEILICEAKNMGITVSEEEIEGLKQMFYPSGEIAKIEDFHKEQAKILGITPEEYYETWSRKMLERNEYIQEYIKSKFGEPTSAEEAEKSGKAIEDYINNLFTTYKESHDLIMK